MKYAQEPSLLLDASGSRLLVGLMADGQLLSRESREPMGQAAQLTQFIDELFLEAGLKPKHLKRIICGIGPGSFTGIRVAIATATGLYAGLKTNQINLELKGISAFTSHRHAYLREYKEAKYREKDLAIFIDSKREEAFGQIFAASPDGVEKAKTGAFLMNISELDKKIANMFISGNIFASPACTNWKDNTYVCPVQVEIQDLWSSCHSQTAVDRLESLKPIYVRQADTGRTSSRVCTA